ncbi:MAG: DUF4176 domain-containing protein [Lachnospiraceae bacterium]|jgi:hypothetical protein|nr:DUF4176 domain-containing protein [Lachnospiraceae bacterium]
MSEEIFEKVLPLGTMVKIYDMDGEEAIYFIIARAIIKNEEEELVSLYHVAPHPYGDVPSRDIFTISEKEIIEIVHLGYRDENDISFIKRNLEELEKVPEESPEAAETAVDAPIIEENEEGASEEIQEKNEDPFYKFRNRE